MKRLLYLIIAMVFITGEVDAYKIFPVPQKLSEGSTEITLTSKVNVILEPEIHQNVKDFVSDVLADAGMTAVFSRFSTANSYIYIGVNGSGGEADAFATTSGVPRDVFTAGNNKYSPYAMQVNTGKAGGAIVILGDAEGSAFYGVATLRQMLGGKSALKTATIEDYSYLQYRGIVEGYYGKPYSVEQLLSLMEFFKLYKLNTFIYGPKSDPYHSGYWKDDYPVTITEEQRKIKGWLTQDDFRHISEKAKECNVNFVWAIHPAMQNGISFASEAAMDPGIELIMEKFDKMYKLGIRGFGIFIDDIASKPNATMTAYLPAQVQAKLKAKYNTAAATRDDKVSPVFFVPAAYALSDGTSTLTKLKDIDPDVVVAFTGSGVWSNVSASDCQTWKNVIGRNPLLWWNNPCNDNLDDHIYTLDMTYRYSAQNAPITALGGVASNPMQQGEVSKIFMFGLADYCWNTASFNAKNNWDGFFPEFIPGNETLRDAFKTFCVNQDPIKEPSSLQTLYNSFKSSYKDHNLPEATTNSLITEAGKIYDACTMIDSEWKNGKDEQYALMYEDIHPWNGKLKSMSYIIKGGLEWMKNPGNINNWTEYANVYGEYKKLHTDSAFITFTLEDAGTNTWERYFEVKPAKQNMEPFVEYLMGKYTDYMPTLPGRTREPEIIHNLSTLPSQVKLAVTDEAITLSGLNNVTLSSGDCVGIYINKLKETVISTPEGSLPSEFVFEYSVNGKEWAKFVPDGKTAIEMAYFRIRNITPGVSKQIGIDKISAKMIAGGAIKLASASTNIPQYQTNSINNIINYSNSGLFWSSRGQQVGDYVRVDIGEASKIYKVELLFDNDDQPTGDCVIEISSDASNWETVASFPPSDIVSKIYSGVVAGNKTGRYVQMRFTSVSGNKWFKLSKFKIHANKEITVASDNKGDYTAVLDDRSLSTSYKGKGEGYITYSFIENLNFEKIQIFHNSNYAPGSELPTITMIAGGKEVDMGTLADPLTELEVSTFKNISALRINWNGKNTPDIYDVVVSGSPYVQDHDITGVEDTDMEDVKVFFSGDKMYINGYNGKVSVYNAAGINIYSGNIENGFSLPAEGHGVFIVNFAGKSVKAVK